MASTSPIRVWIHSAFLRKDSQSAVAVLMKTFAKEEIITTDVGSISCDAVVLFLDADSPWAALVAEVANWTKEGVKVLLLYYGERPLAFYKVWELLALGAEDLINWKQSEEVGLQIISKLRRWKTIEIYLQSPSVKKSIIGNSKSWNKVLRAVVETAYFTKANILITGESGTGKELIAQLSHRLDQRPDKAKMTLLDCSALNPELSGSEFFGHEKGAFTNAVSSREGAFALADKGSLFLDEVGELPLSLQAALLRVIQEGTYKKLGSNIWRKSTFRLIGATNRNLQQEIKRGAFREDLYYRIATCVFELPPLRDRRADIPDLTEYFLREALQTPKAPEIDKALMSFLLTRDYPGNIRELKQLVYRIAYRYTGIGKVTVGDLPESDRPKAILQDSYWENEEFRKTIRQALLSGIGLKEFKKDIANIAMDIAIEDANGNLQTAADRLNISDRTLQLFQSAKKEEPKDQLLEK